MQSVYRPQPGDLERKLETAFPVESERVRARRLLANYGEEEWDTGIDSVRIAALYNSEGSVEKLRSQIELANTDYCDVIASAKYRSFPELPAGVQPESAEYEVAVEADTRRCHEWIES